MLKIHNTLSQKNEVFAPRHKKRVNLFVCGPTVYDFSHLGHARTYIAFDMIASYLKSLGYKVFYLQNITDLDDKIIDRAKQENVSWQELSNKFEAEYLRDIKALGISSVKKYAKATKYIKEIVSQVKKLIEKGYAYKLEDGIYYDISRFKDYGKLAKRTFAQAEDAVSRVDEAVGKRNKGDFSLWKYSKQGEPSWPFGSRRSLGVKVGRPGWHIEDTAITEKHFGPQYDIHGGAQDLIFPHHEAEISQMEAISGKKPLVKYWMHTGFLTVGGQKMSKSLGNFITIRDFLKDNPARLLRMIVLKSHYRSPIDYNKKILSQTKKELERIDEFVEKLKRSDSPNINIGKQSFKILNFKKRFLEAMEDDFNTPTALAAIFQLIGKGNLLLDKGKLTKTNAAEIIKFLKETDKIFKFIFWGKRPVSLIPEMIKNLAEEREIARKNSDWRKADSLRMKILEMGYNIDDTKRGPVLKKIRI